MTRVFHGRSVRPSTLVLAFLALAPLAAGAADVGAVLLVREGPWPYVDDAGPAVRVDGLASSASSVRRDVAARLDAGVAVALTLRAVIDDEAVRVDVTAAPHVVLPRDVVVRLVGTDNGVAQGDVVTLALSEAVNASVVVTKKSTAVAAWVQVLDDPTGRFARGEVLQATSSAVPGEVEQHARGVLVESQRCPACVASEAAARDAASAFASPSSGTMARGYAFAPSFAQVAAGVVLFVAVAAAFVPWRRSG